MPREDGLLYRHEVAEILQVTVRHTHSLSRTGRLLPADRGARGDDLFRPEEVYALQSVRAKRLDLPDVASMALQAHALSRSLQQRMDKLCRLMGLEINRLSYEEDSVHALHLRVLEHVKNTPQNVESGAMMDWASVLHAIDESYLRVVEDYTLNEEPWSPYLQLAHALVLGGKVKRDVNEQFAYACLESARKHLRHVAYFYVHTKRGAQVAKAAFTHDVDDEIIGQLYPMRIGPS